MAAVTFDLYGDVLRTDPYPVYARLREEAPVYRNDERDYWALSRYDDVLSALRNVQRFSSANGPLLEPAIWGPEAHRTISFLAMDPPSHTRMRGLVSKAFTARRVGALEPEVRRIARGHIGNALQSDAFDFVADIAANVPMDVISELIGVPEADRVRVRDLGNTVAQRQGVTDIPPESAEALLALVQYYTELIAERRREPRDDLVSALTLVRADGDRLTDEDIVACLFLLVTAGNETTVRLLGNAWYWAWRHPEQRAMAFSGLIGEWVEETLRYDNPGQATARLLTEDITLHGVRIPKGARMLLIVAAALRDPDVFPDPDRFDLRRDTTAAIPFGVGPHHCLGAPLARLESRIVLEELVARVRDYDIDPDGVEPSYGTSIRGFRSVPTTVTPR